MNCLIFAAAAWSKVKTPEIVRQKIKDKHD
jgi:hypothetical protein